MKNNRKHIVLLGILCLTTITSIMAQNDNCVQCNGCSVTGNNASAIGNSNTASGNNSFAGGYRSEASGANSFAFGYNSKATQSTNAALGNSAEASGIGSIAIGNNVKASAQNAFAFGAGTTTSYPLTNTTPYSIAFGVNSNKPTMLITKSLNNNYTGKVAIGQVTAPQTKLHIKADNNEDAGLFLEPTNKNLRKAFIRLFDSNHTITVDKTLSMEFRATTGSLNFIGNHYCFGNTDEKRIRIFTTSTPSLYYNVDRNKNVELREKEGVAYAIDFNDNALQFRTASSQIPRGQEITNWKTNLLLNTDGKVGIGSATTYLNNEGNDNLVIHSPNHIDLQSQNIRLNGKIGINTENNVNDYALAVNGGIVSTKVFIKEVNLWPDHVFSDDYSLMGFEELESYLKEHRHLPGVPSEAEVTEKGYDLHEMQYVMLEKIEEMTRYILLLKGEIDDLKTQKEQLLDSIRFTYDENGNRISRSLVFIRITDTGSGKSEAPALSYEMYPNPTPGQFSIGIQENSEHHRLRASILNMAGVVLEERMMENGLNHFDISGYPNGIYLLETEGPEGRQSWKIIKQQ